MEVDIQVCTDIAHKVMGWSANLETGFWEGTKWKVATSPVETYERGFFRPDSHYTPLQEPLDRIRDVLGVEKVWEWKGSKGTVGFIKDDVKVIVRNVNFKKSNLATAKCALIFWEQFYGKRED